LLIARQYVVPLAGLCLGYVRENLLKALDDEVGMRDPAAIFLVAECAPKGKHADAHENDECGRSYALASKAHVRDVELRPLVSSDGREADFRVMFEKF
jgi:hypothetical protein